MPLIIFQLYYGSFDVNFSYFFLYDIFTWVLLSLNNMKFVNWQMYTEGSPAVQQNNQTALVYFKNAADKVRYIYIYMIYKFG